MRHNVIGHSHRARRALIAATAAVMALGGVGLGVAHAVTSHASTTPPSRSATTTDQNGPERDQPDVAGQPDVPEPGDVADNSDDLPGRPDLPEPGDTPDTH